MWDIKLTIFLAKQNLILTSRFYSVFYAHNITNKLWCSNHVSHIDDLLFLPNLESSQYSLTWETKSNILYGVLFSPVDYFALIKANNVVLTYFGSCCLIYCFPSFLIRLLWPKSSREGVTSDHCLHHCGNLSFSSLAFSNNNKALSAVTPCGIVTHYLSQNWRTLCCRSIFTACKGFP